MQMEAKLMQFEIQGSLFPESWVVSRALREVLVPVSTPVWRARVIGFSSYLSQ